MKLTLRTLLAYLDDVLEPNEAREIGQKINQSKEAAALVTQVREAIRRRRIGAPELAGPGSGPDPNIVSEYLENVLSPNQVVEYEKLCRSSELHLAEIAACHKILTMVMGQPIDVSDELRERMYELGATKAETLPSQSPEPQPAPQMTSGMGTPEPTSFGEGLPDYLKKGRSSGRIWTTLLVLVIAGVWVGLIVSDPSIWNKNSGEKLAENSSGEPVIAEQGEIAEGAEDDSQLVSKEGEQTPNAGGAKQLSVQRKVSPQQKKQVSINPPPPADSEVAANSIPKPNLGTPNTLNTPTEKMQSDTSSDANGKPDQIAANTKVDVPPTIKKPPLGKLVAKNPLTIFPPDAINILHSEQSDHWGTITGGEISFGDSFAVPIPFQGKLNFRDDLTLQVFGGTRITRLPSVEGTDLSIRLERGQLLVKRPATSIHPRVIAITVGKNSWKFNLSETETELAIGVSLPQPEGRIFDDAPIEPSGGIAVTQGKLTLELPEEKSLELQRSSGWITWATRTGELLTDQPAAIPAWTNPDAVLMTPARRQLSKAYEREFQEDVLQSIAPVTADRRAIIAEFAVLTLALTDNYLEIVPALISDHEEARMAAILSLREWLAEDPDRITPLREEMERLFRSELVEQITTMLWGYSRLDAQSPETSQMLVELLGNEDLAIRELAHFHVTRLTGRNYGYHSQAPIAERNAAISRWVEFVKRDKSLVQPE